MSVVAKIRVFAGLSITTDEVQSLIPSAQVCGAVKYGDLYQAIKDQVNVVAIVDGKFFQSQAVSPCEIMDAMRVGMRIYGSSSMGALRAAELDVFGMIGIGRVYHRIKSTPYFRDDYLGQSFDSETGEIFSQPLVDLLANLDALVEKDSISSSSAQTLTGILESPHFADRSLDAAIAKVKSLNISDEVKLVEDLVKIFDKTLGSQKKRDAVEMLQTINADLERISGINRTLKNTIPPRSKLSAELFYQ